MLGNINTVNYVGNKRIVLRPYLLYMDSPVFSVASPTLCSIIGPCLFHKKVCIFYPRPLCDIVGPFPSLINVPVFIPFICLL